MFALPMFTASRPATIVGVHVLNFCVRDGEREERRLRWKKRPERVAGVGVQRSRSAGKAHTGHPNRKQVDRSNCSHYTYRKTSLPK